VATSPDTANSPKSYYILGYYTSNQKQDGQFRRIQVIDKADTTAKVDFRAGYYSNKPFVPTADATAGTGVVQPAATLPPGSTAPILIFKKEAEYSDEARKAKYQGSVTLYVEVNENGHPNNIKVLRSLGLGLDEKSIEAVKQWRFKPGTANGVPVTMPTQVKVDFRLL
jgi:TonB family protein